MGKKVIPVINNKHDIRFVGAEAGHLAGFDKDGKIIDGGTGFELPANPSDGKVLMWSNGELVWGTPFTLPSGGQSGQVLGLDENGQLAWLTVTGVEVSSQEGNVNAISPSVNGTLSAEPYTPPEG